MRPPHVLALCALSALAFTGAASQKAIASPAAYAPPASDTKAVELFKLGKEKKSNSEVKGSKFRLTRAETFVSAPMSEVRKAVLDYGKYSTIIPAFQKSKVLKQDGTAAQVFLQIPFLKGAANIWTVESFTAPVADGKGEKITGTKIKSNIDDIKATWLYRPVDDAHTVLTLEIYVSLDVPAPLSLITSETEDACGHGVRGVKAHAESSVTAKTPAK